MNPTDLHIDVVRNECTEKRQVRMVKANIDVIHPLSGDYIFTTVPHDDEHCPFRDGDVIPMRVESVTAFREAQSNVTQS